MDQGSVNVALRPDLDTYWECLTSQYRATNILQGRFQPMGKKVSYLVLKGTRDRKFLH